MTENLFDQVMALADTTIRQVMGVSVKVVSDGQVRLVRGVFDDAESLSYAIPGIRIEGTAPTLFVSSADIPWMQRFDTVLIGDARYFVDRIGPDDAGSCVVYLGVGEPPTNNRRQAFRKV